MPVKISLSKTNLSLTYNVSNASLTGDTSFRISVLSAEEAGLSAFIQYDKAFNFNPIQITDFSAVIISPGIQIPTIPGNYNFSYDVTSEGAFTKTFYIQLKVINDDTTPPTPEDTTPKLKYWFEYKNQEDDAYRLEIFQKGYKDDPIETHGRFTLKYQDKTDLFDPIISSSISIDFEADEDLSMTDLYSEEEQTFQVIAKRNDAVIFIGYIKPDGIYEDWVSNKCTLSVDAFDGLSTLKNLAFQQDNGGPFQGKLTILDAIKNCLHRTGLDLHINESVKMFYEGFSTGGNGILEAATINTERYYQDTAKVMDCESVLKSLLQIFNATIVQMNGEWWIYRAIDLKEDTYFSRYINGVFDKYVGYRPDVSIGSHQDGYNPFHCSANQKRTIAASVQAYRIYYQYGNAANIVSNGELKFEGGLNIPGWTVNAVGNEVRRLGDSGLSSDTVNYNTDVRLISLNQNLDIKEGNIMTMRISFANFDINTGGLMYSIGVGGKWFNLKNGNWQDGMEMNLINNSNREVQFQGQPSERVYNRGRGVASYELKITSPVSGRLEIIIWRDQATNGSYGGHLNGKFELYNISVIPDNQSNLKGKYYTGQRTSRISTVTKSDITVYNGDSDSSLYVGTLYEANGTTGTEKWYRQNRVESLELLEINAEDNLRLSPRPMQIFEGSIYGYIPYLSIININNITGKFQPIKYTFDPFENIIKLSSKEFSSDYLAPDQFIITASEDTGTETKVTIT